MSNTRSISWLLSLFILFLPFSLNGQKLVAVIAADQSGGIEQGVSRDIDKFSLFTRQAAAMCGMESSVIIFTDNTFKKKILVSYLSKLELDEEDFLIFFYTGHGYRGFLQESRWPNLFFSFKEKGLGGEKLFSLLDQTGSKNQLILLDTCNEYFPYFTDSKIDKSPFILPQEPEIYQTLFHAFKGKAILCSSSEGELAYTVDSGSIFTNAFFSAFWHLSDQKEKSWEALFDLSSELAKDRSPSQNAFYTIFEAKN